MDMEVFCEHPFTRVRVTSEGRVAMCCFQRPDPLLPDNDPYLGNLLEQPFDDIWFGDVAEDIRSHTIEGVLHAKCRCPGCPFVSLRPPFPTKTVIYNEYPTFLEIDLPNTHCNVGGVSPGPDSPACVMCERAGGPGIFRPERDRLKETLEQVVHVVPNLRQIHIQGIAEPFYKDILFDILDVLRYDDHRDHITVSTTTNATLLKPAVRKRYLDRVPHSITNFSLDAATPETFRRIRIFDCFEQVVENIYAFNRERVRPRQFLRLHNNINILNVHEVVGMCRIAAKADAEYVEFNPTDGHLREILVNEGNCGLFKRAERDIIEECQKLGLPYTFLRPLDLGMCDNLLAGGF